MRLKISRHSRRDARPPTPTIILRIDTRSSLSKCLLRLTMSRQGIRNARHHRRPPWYLPSNRISLSELILLVLVKLIDIGRSELAGGNPFGEENIELVERAILGLWKSEVRPDEDGPCAATPYEATVSLVSNLSTTWTILRSGSTTYVYPRKFQALGFIMKFSRVPPIVPEIFDTFRARQTVFCRSLVDPISAGRAHPN
jgi:hypothetical protein